MNVLSKDYKMAHCLTLISPQSCLFRELNHISRAVHAPHPTTCSFTIAEFFFNNINKDKLFASALFFLALLLVL